MPKLKIHFEQMFLVVRNIKAPVVLLPTGGREFPHDLFIINAAPKPLAICRADISVVAYTNVPERDGRPYTNSTKKNEWPDHDHVLHFKNLVAPADEADARVPAALYSKSKTPDCPPELHARFFLPYGESGGLGTSDCWDMHGGKSVRTTGTTSS